MKIRIFKVLLLSVFVFTACKSAKYKDLENGVYANIQTDKGEILLELYAKDLPLTVSNFVALAEGTHPKVADSLKGRKYYDGLKFHRVIPNFMIQGGDLAGTGAGNPGYRFDDEFPKDTLGALKYRHTGAGVLSMANSGPRTNGTQFFITHKATQWLDGKHSIFGKVVTGQGIVDSIAQNDIIKHVEIIRLGKDARRFDAPEVFENEFGKAAKREEERIAKDKELRKAFLAEMGYDKTVPTNSGLRILSLKKGKGKKVTRTSKNTVYYTLRTETGKVIQSNEGKTPFEFVVDNPKLPLIAGWKEGVLTMKDGDKSRLFIPYYLGWGERGSGPIAPKADLVMDIEVVKVTNK